MAVEGSADLRTRPGPHVFAENLESLEIDGEDHHHLVRVLRLRPGDALTVSDGSGRWRDASFGEPLEPAGPIHHQPEPSYPLRLAIALTKAAKPELVVQKATELGIDELILFEATHSVARWDRTKRDRNLPRLERVAREAAMQSRRSRLPRVTMVDDLVAIAALGGAVRADFGGEQLGADHHLVVIGPEGGWSHDERRILPDSVDLGPTVLRAETAALVAACAMVGHRHQGR